MDAPLSDSPAQRPRTGTLRRSCESCRALKARCVLDMSASQHQRHCQRCSSNGIDCVFEEALARPKRARQTARTRVKDVEDKIDNLIALIAARNSAPETPKSVADILLPPNPPLNTEDVAAMYNSSSRLPSILISPDLDLPGSPPMSEPMFSLHDVFSKDIISLEMGESLLATFAAREFSMPFVVLAPHMKFDYLRRSRPCMLLAIMSTTASDSGIQEKLSDEFRQFVAQNVIVTCQKSIDIIQGIIIFCAYHHLSSRPRIHQLYQMIQVAVTMAIDLGLPALPQIYEMDPQKVGLAKSSRESNPQFWDDLEHTRAYLYCYCVSSCISRSLRKPNQLKHSRRIEEAAKVVASLKMRPCDDLLPHFIRTQRFIEEVEAVFRYNDPDGLDEIDGWKIHNMARAFERRLTQLRESTPPEILANPFIKMNFLFLPIYITEIGLSTPPGHDRKRLACCDWCASVHRDELIISCVRASQLFLDEFLALSNDVIKMLNIAEFGLQLYVIMILARATMQQNMGSLDANLRVELANIEPYLAASETKTASLLTYLPDGSVKQDSFWQMSQFFSNSTVMFAKWKAESTLLPPKDCDFSLNLDFLMDPLRIKECNCDSLETQLQTEMQQPITPESPSNWGSDHELILASLTSLSPPPSWFQV